MDEPLVTVFEGNGYSAEMEAQSVRALLEADGIDSVVVRENVPEIPLGRVTVRVLASEAARAEELLRDAQTAGTEAVEQVESESEL